MKARSASAGSALFLVLAPGVVAGVVPFALTRWRMNLAGWAWAPLRLAGLGLILFGAIALLWSFVQFVGEGRGTPAPVAPTDELVVGGLYRYVRNPMYVAVAAVIGGQAAWFGQRVLVLYLATFMAVVAAFVHGYEEPVLAARFGERYERYRRAVPAWHPRRAPWRPPPSGS